MNVTEDKDQSCIGCGRMTHAGTPLFSDRHTTRADDGGAIYLCGDCNERAIDHFGRAPTEADTRQIVARSSSFGTRLIRLHR